MPLQIPSRSSHDTLKIPSRPPSTDATTDTLKIFSRSSEDSLPPPVPPQILLARADSDYPAGAPPPLRFIRSCSSSLAPATLHKLEAAFKAPVLEVGSFLGFPDLFLV